MTIQDKYSKANSRRYRATHGGIQSNRAKNQAASSNTVSNDTEKFPALKKDDETKAEDDENQEIEPEEEEEDQNYARRRIDTNLDRYHEPEPEPDAEPEPEVDLSEFLRKQAACLTTAPIPLAPEEDDDDVDHAFSHLFLQPRKIHNLRQLSAEEASELSQLDDERKKADASRELRARFSGKDVKARSKAPARRLAKHQQGSTAASVSKDSGEGDRATALVGPLDDEAFLDEVLGDSSGTYGNIRRKK